MSYCEISNHYESKEKNEAVKFKVEKNINSSYFKLTQRNFSP